MLRWRFIQIMLDALGTWPETSHVHGVRVRWQEVIQGRGQGEDGIGQMYACTSPSTSILCR